MSWTWRKVEPCDLDAMADEINPQMKLLEGSLRGERPEVMVGFPSHVGTIVDNATDSHTGDTNETELKSTSFGRGAISAKGGFRVTAAGTSSGGAGAVTITLNWGGIPIGSIALSSGTQQWYLEATFWNIDNTQNQRWILRTWDGTTIETLDLGTDDVDTG